MTTSHTDSAGAGELLDTEGVHHLEEGFDLVVIAGDFDDEKVTGDIDDAGAEGIDELHDLGAVMRVGRDLDEGEVSADHRCVGQIFHLDHVYQLV